MQGAELIAEVCKELAVPFRTNGYRNWETQAPSAV